MKIGILTSEGITLDSFFPELIMEMSALGHEVFTAAGTRASTPNLTLIGSLSREPRLTTFVALANLRKWQRDNRLDVVITNTATASMAVRLARLSVPILYFCHGLHWNVGDSPKSRILQFIEHALLKTTSGVLTLNTDDKQWFASRLDAHHVHYLRYGVGVPTGTYERTDLPGGELSLLWAGTFTQRKRPMEAIRVVEHLLSQSIKVHLVMLGDGVLHQTVAMEVDRRGLSAAIKLPGRRPVVDALDQSHAVLHTAAWEGLPRILLEGYSKGRRSFAYDVKGVRDIPDVVVAEDLNADLLARAIAHHWKNSNMDPTPAPAELDSSAVAAEIISIVNMELRTTPDLSLGR